ncbi:MAG TPA: ABC transporter permease subunit [Candidatus Borkfalkia excrementavium]|uniref:ABC transporter permease subunit n=1 Tax=Candidatus Borkfalkia excrementavium TaxID=2838505 RepID=A0A9D2CGB1_9FIRM|nr:ABC transporter permease subunit [Candidatus Borkfalkia excrementavium]
MNARAKKIILNIVYPVAVVAAVFAVWAIAAKVKGIPVILPSPKSAFSALGKLLSGSYFWRSLAGTLWRACYSFLISFFIALVLAVLAKSSRHAAGVIQPFMSVVRAVPTMAIIYILIIWFSRSLAPVVVAIVVICPTLYSVFLSAIASVDPKLYEMSKVYRVRKADVVFKLYIPNMAPALFEGSASGFSLNVKLIIAAEALASTEDSLGLIMKGSNMNLETARLFAVTIAAVLLSVICEWAIRWIGKAVIRWK